MNSRNNTPILEHAAPALTRLEGLKRYIGSARDAGEIDAQMAERAWDIWCSLSSTADKNLPVPDAAPGPNGEFIYVWNRGEHHLDLEIVPNGPAEFFYLNRSSNESWDDEYTTDDPISQELRARLALFQ